MLPKGVALVGEGGAAWNNVEQGPGVACGNWMWFGKVLEGWSLMWEEMIGKRSWHHMGRVS